VSPAEAVFLVELPASPRPRPDCLLRRSPNTANFSNVLDPQYVSTGTAFAMIGDVRALRPHTPVQLLPDVDIILTDYKLVSDGSRIYSQVLGELNSAYKPLKDFSNQACA
jgi:hypothetical protein